MISRCKVLGIFLHLACSDVGHPVLVIFIKRSHSVCPHHGIRGVDSFHREITRCEDFKKGITSSHSS